jgi:hypothetical protein
MRGIAADFAARIRYYQLNVVFARFHEGVDDDRRSLIDVVATITKVKSVFGNRVDGISIRRSAAVELHR